MKTLEELKNYALSINDLEVKESFLQLILSEYDRENMDANVIVLRIPVKDYKMQVQRMYEEINR